jgi:hypothetical protein
MYELPTTRSVTMRTLFPLILTVEEIRPGHCRVDFGAAKFFDVDGPAADKIVEHVKNAMAFQIVGDIKSPKLAESGRP